MRFLSPHPGYSIQIAPPTEKVETDPITGQSFTRVAAQPLVAHFEAGHGLFPHEVELALQVFGDQGAFGGLPDGTSPTTRIAVWDSEAHKVFNDWSDEMHENIVERMKYLASVSPTRMLAVTDQWRPTPWKTYDTDSVDEIIAFVERLQFDPENVRLYEGENQKRPELLAALKAMAEGTYVAPEPVEDEDPNEGIPVTTDIPSVGDGVEDGEVLATVSA